MRYELTTFTHCLAICKPLMKMSDKETGATAQLDILEQLYEAIERTTPSFAYIVWDGDKPVGLAGIVVSRDPHHRRMVAANETIFVLPEYRGLTSARLFLLCEAEAKRRGAEVFQWTAACGSKLERTLSKRSNYHKQEVMFVKEL